MNTLRSLPVRGGGGGRAPMRVGGGGLGIKVKRKKLVLPLTIDELSRRIERSGVVDLLPVDATTWLRSSSLEWDHADPADRVIVATAFIKGLPLLTKDEAIRTFAGVRAVW